MSSGNRISEWFYSKIPMLMGIAYLSVLMNGDWELDWQLAGSILGLLLTAVGFAAIGYWVNDLFDRKADLKVGKSNLFLQDSKWQIFGVIIGSIACALAPWTWLPKSVVLFGLLGAEILLYVLYAAPPFRLKERGFIGVVVDSTYAHVAPALVFVFVMVGTLEINEVWQWLLLAYVLVGGIRKILFHQLGDLQSDLESGTRTYVVSVGRQKCENQIVNLVEPIEGLAMLALFGWIALQNSVFGILAIVMLLLLFVTTPLAEGVLKYNPLKLDVFNRVLNQVAEIFLPIISLLALANYDTDFLWVLLVHLLVFMPGYMHLMNIGRYHILGPIYHQGILRGYYHVLIPIHSVGRWFLYNVCLRIISWFWHLGYFVLNGRWQHSEKNDS